MARKYRGKQEQLSFPDVLLLPAGETPATAARLAGAGRGEAMGERLAAVGESVDALPAVVNANAGTARRRAGRPPVALVEKPPAAAVSADQMAPGAAVSLADPQPGLALAGAAAAMPEPPAASAKRPALVPVDAWRGAAVGQAPRPVAEIPVAPPRPSVVPGGAVAAPADTPAGFASEMPRGGRPLPPVASVASPVAGGGVRSRWAIAAQMANILAALVFVTVLLFAAYQFLVTQRAQRATLDLQAASIRQARSTEAVERDARATELFIRYNELMAQVPKTARRDGPSWKEGLAIGLLESLFNLTRGDRDWENTIGWALERHQRFIREQRLGCANYSGAFVRYLEKTSGLPARALCRN